VTAQEPDAATATHKLWGGRFGHGPAPELDAVNRSIGIDYRLWPFDIQLSQAWAKSLARAGVISNDESQQLVDGLTVVAGRFQEGAQPAAGDEDIHTMIDRLLHEAAGSVASRLHTGRSRNDQVATASRLWCIDAIKSIDEMVRAVQRALLDQAGTLTDVLMPAYTHMQRAQPVLGAHWLLAHFWPLHRDRRRFEIARDVADTMPLGSGAVAGSAFPIDREFLRAELGFARISENSIDAVGDRDFVAELLFALTMLGVHLSRLAEDLILYGSSEFAFVRYGDAFSTGSSMMPQKRNPDALELARGSAARMLGDLVSILATLKGLPTSYNKDLQDDKRALFDAVDGMRLLLPAVAGSIATLTFRPDRMRAAVTSAMMATDLADHLVRKGVTFRDAHAAVGALVRQAEEQECEISDLSAAQISAAHNEFGNDILRELDASNSIAHRSLPGGTSAQAVQSALMSARATLGRQDGGYR
jgi:argininosuccinate lyase